MRLMTKIATGITAAAIAGAGVTLAAAPANAATGSCGSGYHYLSGKNHVPVTYKGKVAGHADLYYNSRTGKNCAIVRASTSGVSHITVLLSRYDSRNKYPEKTVTQGFNSNFHSYAGPVSIWARGRCISVVGSLRKGGHAYYGSAIKVHCGKG